MSIKIFDRFESLERDDCFASLEAFINDHPQGNFFQTPSFFRFIEGVPGFEPFQLVALTTAGEVEGSLLGTFQYNGSGLTSYLSRRLIVWGGPLLALEEPALQREVAGALLTELKKSASGNAIYLEFRNFYDTTPLQAVFEEQGFVFHPHLNFLVRTDEESTVQKRMSGNRRRQIRKSLDTGAVITEAASEEEVLAFYEILRELYAEKVKKPLAGPELFTSFWQSDAGKFFLVKYDDTVVGGSMCPVYAGRVIYDWFRCGELNVVKGLHTGVLAAWAPIKYGLEHGFEHMDFMGAGKPDEEYGVRTFKEPFGGELVAFGRYTAVLNKPLYQVGKWGISVYQKIKG